MVLTSKSAIWKKKIHKTKDPMKQPPHADSTKLPECERMPRSLSVPSQHGILNAKPPSLWDHPMAPCPSLHREVRQSSPGDLRGGRPGCLQQNNSDDLTGGRAACLQEKHVPPLDIN